MPKGWVYGCGSELVDEGTRSVVNDFLDGLGMEDRLTLASRLTASCAAKVGSMELSELGVQVYLLADELALWYGRYENGDADCEV